MMTDPGRCLVPILCLAGAVVAGRAAAGAEVFRIDAEHASASPRGKEADAIPGDYLIRNDRVAATIGGVAGIRDANVNTQAVQGAVLDLVRLELPGGNNDLLDAYYPHGHYLDAPAPTEVAILRDRGPEVTIRFSRAAAPGMQGDPVDVETDYTLRDGEPFLRIATTYRNRGSGAARAAIYDKIRADKPFVIPPAGDSRWLIYREPWHGAAYGVARAGGGSFRSYANPASKTYFLAGGNRLDFPELLAAGAGELGESLPAPASIPAGGAVTVERYLVPGRHPADVQAVLAGLLGREALPVAVLVVDDAGRPVADVAVLARRVGARDARSEGRTDAAGRLALVLDEAGDYELVANRRGRAEARARVTVPAAGAVAIGVGPPSEVTFDVTEGGRRGPARVQLRGLDGTPDPDFGPELLPDQAGHLCFSATGAFVAALPPGRYEASIGRGPEFDREVRAFEVGYGRPVTVRAELRRAFTTPGWVIADLHNHTTASNDSIAETRGRVVGIAAAGVEFAPATEHNRITSFAPAIAAEGLGAFLATAGGVELSGRPGPGNTNHQNAFPLAVRAGVEGGGAPRTDKDPRVQIGRLAQHDGGAEKFVQQNHPDLGWLYFDRDRDGRPDGGYGTRPFTHAIELNRNIAALLDDLETPPGRPGRGVAFGWLQMLNQGDRIYATANSDAHTTGFHNGSIFTYIRSEVDDPARLDPTVLARAARAGRMVLSNGPFLDASVAGVGPGGDVAAAGGRATLAVRVLAAAGVDVDRVQVLVNGRPDPALNWTRATHPEAFPAAGPTRFERSAPLALTADAHIIVVAAGEHGRLGPAHGPYAAQRPTAISNPIFVDVDGDGFVPNRDTLGVPLPLFEPSKGAPGEAE